MQPVMHRVKLLPLVVIGYLLIAASAAVALDPPSGIRLAQPTAEIYPIGWSRDGKFAYALVDEPAFRGGYGFYSAIVDARTDEVLWSQYDHSDQFGQDTQGAPLALAWSRNAPTLNERLTAFGIEPVTDATLMLFPLLRGSERYTPQVVPWRVNPQTSPHQNGVVGYTLSITSTQRGSKVIARRGGLFTTDIEVQGYFRSPFENRIVLLVAESGNAYGGARFTDFAIIGSNLDVGFQ